MNTRIPGRFYAVAALVGIMNGNFFLGVPLLSTSTGRSAAFVGAILAASTVATSLGALLTGALMRRIPGGYRLVAAAMFLGVAGFVQLLLPWTVVQVAGSVALGFAMGFFWVGSHVILGGRSGSAGSEKPFIWHYGMYTAGAVAGAASTGVVAQALSHVALAGPGGARGTFVIGASSGVLALLLWLPLVGAPNGQPAIEPSRFAIRAPLRGLSVQLPDLLLVSALSFVLPLAPIVLASEFTLRPEIVGILVAGVQAAKIAGLFTARMATGRMPVRRTILVALGLGSILSLALSLAHSSTIFVIVLFGTAFMVNGIWPLMVDASLSRVRLHERPEVTAAWHTREFASIAATTALAGWLLTAVGYATPLFLIAATMLAAALAVSVAVLRRPVHKPEMASTVES